MEWLTPVGVGRVLELGAGSGQLTRSLIDRVPDVGAVEPDEKMREQFAQVLPAVQIFAGSAEDIPLESSSVDAVLVGQAWHWIDPARAEPEVARVLRDGGTPGLVWNIRDERVDWVAELGAIMRTSEEIDMRSDNPSVGRPFAPIERGLRMVVPTQSSGSARPGVVVKLHHHDGVCGPRAYSHECMNSSIHTRL